MTIVDTTTDPRAHWDTVAALWSAWEHLGTDGWMMAPFLPSLRSPILVAGAGQGMLMEGLRKCGFEVEGIDSSWEMIAEARRRRSIEILHARAEELPFDDRSFSSIVVQTGVLTDRSAEAVKSVLRETVRVLTEGGVLIAGFAMFSKPATGVLRTLGLIDDAGMYPGRFLDLWAAGPVEHEWAELIARWRGVSRPAAEAALSAYRDFLYATYATWEQFAQAIREQGGAPEPALRGMTPAGSVPVFTFDDYIAIFAESGLQVCESHWAPEVNTLHLMGRRLRREN